MFASVQLRQRKNSTLILIAMVGGVCQEYDIICNNCGDWGMDILAACCLDGSYLPYLIY